MKKLVSKDQLIALLNYSIIGGLLGGRVLHLLVDWSQYSSWVEWFAFWQGGLSVLGSAVGIFLVLFFFTLHSQVPFWKLLDRIALYAPLAQAFGRVGCFSAGCCYGCMTTCSWGVFLCQDGACSLVHPVQLYNVAALLLVFVLLLFLDRYFLRPGVLSLLSLGGIFLVRGVTDFWRGDREWVSGLPYFSIHQWISFALLFGIAMCLIWLFVPRRRY